MDESNAKRFHSADAHEERISNIIDIIGTLKNNLTMFNPMFNKYNYELIYIQLKKLLIEEYYELSKTEQDELTDKINAIKSFMANHEIIHQTKKCNSETIIFNLNKNEMNVLNNALEKCELKLMCLLHKNGHFGSSEKEM